VRPELGVYGGRRQGCAQALKGQGAPRCHHEIDPICALQACEEGYQVRHSKNVVKTLNLRHRHPATRTS